MADSFGPPAFVLPGALLSKGFSLRRETDADLPFLMQVYASTRADELARMPWDDDQKRAFLIHQFGAQRQHYYSFFADASFDVIEQNGIPVGRLYLHERQTRVSVIDIVMMPDRRGTGTGTAILTAVQDYAQSRGKGVDIFVEHNNQARTLYDRLGFRIVREESVYYEMDWAPDGVS